mgnify:CR=1 FL=1
MQKIEKESKEIEMQKQMSDFTMIYEERVKQLMEVIRSKDHRIQELENNLTPNSSVMDTKRQEDRQKKNEARVENINQGFDHIIKNLEQ